MSATSDFSSNKNKSTLGLPGSAPSSGRNTANSSPTDRELGRHSMNNSTSAANIGRMGAGSPSYDGSASGSRLFSKRAREIQAEEGVAPPVLWGPMSSNNNQQSSSLRDRESVIPESPQQNGFTETTPATAEYSSPVYRRARAGTVPSRFSPGGVATAPPNIPGIPSTSRPSPAPSPFKANTPQPQEQPDMTPVSVPSSNSETRSRLRSGSLNIPPRTNYINPFGPSIFATAGSWGRERSATNLGLPNLPSSPAQSSFSKDDDGSHMAPRTLDYLGLVDTPQTSRATLAKPAGLDTLIEGQRAAAMQPFISEIAGLQRNLNRIRSYSVNAKEKYAEDEDEEDARHMYNAHQSGNVTPSSLAAAAQASAHAQAQAHAMAIAQFAGGGMTPNRPRARTAGVLEAPPSANRLKNYLATPSKLDSMTTASDLGRDYFDMSSVDALKLAALGGPRPSSGEGGLGSIEESQLEGPTRSLWLGNIPASTTTTSLIHIFQPFGTVESARVLTHKNCGFINYATVENAIQARVALNGKEIFPGAGPTRIGFAKPSSAGSNGTPTPNGGAYGSPSPDPNTKNTGAEGGVALPRESGSGTSVNGKDSAAASAALELPDLADLKDDILAIVREFGAEDDDADGIAGCIGQAATYDDFEPEIPSIPEPNHNRVHDAPKLRDIRKRIDNGNCSQAEIEEIAIAMLSEVAELSSDYLGNTVVQKLFEHCSEEIKETMLVEIGPHLAEIGIHKNGTWAGQKIIDVAKTPAQMNKITDCLRPYTVALFLDQYGNYVLQCCLRFGAPWNNFIFETMLGRMWEISQGRFGSRAMRACLESHHANKNQQRMMAAAIALHSVQLATNANGALLLTWFLDTCNFPRRRTVLAPRLVPHLVHLCTHKVAYLTVLKVINQKNEPEARETILRALFFSPGDQVLEDILKDHSCGATLIFKVLTTPFFEESMRADVVQNVRNVLLKLKASPSQGYKRLMDEVGLSTRNGLGNNRESSKDRGGNDREGNERRSNQNSNQNTNGNNTPTQGNRTLNSETQQAQAQYYNAQPMYDPAIIASAAAQLPQSNQFDQQTLRALEQLNLGASMYTAPGLANPAFPYQLLQQQMAAGAGRPGAGFYGIPGMAGFNNPQATTDQFRGAQGTTPMPPPGIGNSMMGGMGVGVGPTFNPLVAQQLMGGYGFGMSGMPMFPQQQQQQQQQTPQAQQGGGNSGRRGGSRR